MVQRPRVANRTLQNEAVHAFVRQVKPYLRLAFLRFYLVGLVLHDRHLLLLDELQVEGAHYRRFGFLVNLQRVLYPHWRLGLWVVVHRLAYD